MISKSETERACGAENCWRTKILSLINFCVSNFRHWVDRQKYFDAEDFQIYGTKIFRHKNFIQKSFNKISRFTVEHCILKDLRFVLCLNLMCGFS